MNLKYNMVCSQTFDIILKSENKKDLLDFLTSIGKVQFRTVKSERLIKTREDKIIKSGHIHRIVNLLKSEDEDVQVKVSSFAARTASNCNPRHMYLVKTLYNGTCYADARNSGLTPTPQASRHCSPKYSTRCIDVWGKENCVLHTEG